MYRERLTEVLIETRAGRVPGLPIRECEGSYNSSEHRQTTIDSIPDKKYYLSDDIWF